MKIQKKMVIFAFLLTSVAPVFSMGAPRLDTYVGFVNPSDSSKNELGQIAINARGGAQPYKYVTFKNVPVKISNMSIISNLEPGAYTVFVIDDLGRTNVHQAEIKDKTAA